MTIWIVKAGYQGFAADKFRSRNKIAVGWHALGDFPTNGDWSTFRAAVKKLLPPEYSERRVGSAAGQLWAFAHDMQPGDFVITPVTAERQILVGKIVGEYKFDRHFDEQLPRTRSVEWFTPIRWDDIPHDLRSTFSVWQTITRPVRDFTPIIEAARNPAQAQALQKAEKEPDTSVVTSGTENLADRAEDIIRQMLQKMDHEAFQRFVGAIFQAAGFTELFNSAGRGPDGGIDIILSKDPLGAGARIIVQVKHTGTPVGRPELQQLLGTLKPNEHGLMVSLNGINSSSEQYWRENRDRLLRPMESSDLIQLLQENYDRLRDEQKAMLPLKRVFVPFNPDEEG